MHRPEIARIAVAGLALTLAAIFHPAQGAGLAYLGQQIVPTGTMFGGTTVGGLSGIDRNPLTGAYVAISDDRSSINPARYYDLSLNVAAFVRSANPGNAGVAFTGVHTILQPGGAAFPTSTVDPESIRINPATGNLFWSNEGQRTAAGFQTPTVREMTPAGAWTKSFAVPTRYNPAGTTLGASPGDSGVQNNLAFESLTVSTDGSTLYTATENSLVQDGPIATVGSGSNSRILSFDTASGAAGAEYLYRTEPVALPPNPAGGFATNGLVELLAFGDRQFIAVERSFAAGAATPGAGPNGLPTGNTIRLFYVDARNASDIRNVDSVFGASNVTAVSKTLLLDLSTLQNDDGSALALDNIEGISWGPVVNGQDTLILVSDNNFGAGQFTQFVALAVTAPIPEPAAVALWAVGLLALAMRAQRKSPSR